MAELKRASVFGIKEETTVGTLIALTSGDNFMPLRPDFGQSLTFEEIETDELLNDIGMSEPTLGKETPSGSHTMYLKHSGVEGQEPETGLLYESCLGSKTVNATQYNTVSSSTTTVINVDTGEGANFYQGQALLIKDATNGYSIRNVESISSDALTLNFALSNAPASGVDLGKAITYLPTSSGHPSFSAWLYYGNGSAVSAVAGCQASSLTFDFPANQPASVSVTYEGTSGFYNPFVITSSNNKLDMTDDGGTIVATIAVGTYKTPIALASEITTKATAASVGSGNDTITCTYNSVTGKFTLASNGTTFSLLHNSGANTANKIGTILGYVTASDDTGSTSYIADNSITLSAAYTPTYDDQDVIIVKDSELMIGTQTENICRCANNVSITVDRPSSDVDDICSISGTSEKIPESRAVTLTATLILKKYESSLFDKFINNTDVSVMLNAGKKDSSRNFIAGRCANFFMQKAKISSHTVEGDSYLTVNLTAKGFVTTSKKDLFLNFV